MSGSGRPAPAAGVSFEYEGRSYVPQPGESLLDTLLRQGAEVAHSCRRGSCQTCVLHVEAGRVEHDRAVDPQLLGEGFALPCLARAAGEGLRLRRPMPGELGCEAEILALRPLAEDIVAIDIAPARSFDFRAGQYVQVEGQDGLRRPYSLASRAQDDFFFSIHVRRLAEGRMSRWLCDEARPGQRLRLQGPLGDCCYRPELRERPLRLLATGTGAGAMAALAREALEEGHVGGIVLYHGVRRAADLYLDTELRELARRFPRFAYRPCVSGEAGIEGVAHARVVDALLADGGELGEAELFLCGLPLMVEEARYRARLAGVPAERMRADPFVFAHPRAPRDAEKLAAIRPDPELWAALEQGPGLTRVLDAFYTRVYADARLSPFFHRVAKSHAVAKQYEFLAALFSGSGTYFGLNPYNAHHWMVISDELFDYREALFEAVLRESGLAPHLIDRWLALHELFRAEIVKAQARGIVSQGVEQAMRVQSVERLEIDAVCDACGAEIPAGQACRYVFRIGALHCARCAGIGPDAAGSQRVA